MDINKIQSIEDIAYSEELRELIVQTHKQELVLACMATMKSIQGQIRSGHIVESELVKIIMAAVTGTFIIGFKQGNDYFLDEAEKEKV